MHKDLVVLEDLNVRIGSSVILSNINLKITPGKVVTLMGPNGAGKSTLLRVILGLIKPTQGQVVIKDGLRIGYMPQKLQLDPSLPITVDYFLKLTNASKVLSVTSVLKSVGALKLQNSSMHNLSGGELQRVLLARALMGKPDLLILDEPLQGVDIQGQKSLYALLAEIHHKWKCAVLIVSHDMHMVFSESNEVICLNKHICCTGQPESIVHEPEYIKLFGSAVFAAYKHEHDHSHDALEIIEGDKHA